MKSTNKLIKNKTLSSHRLLSSNRLLSSRPKRRDLLTYHIYFKLRSQEISPLHFVSVEMTKFLLFACYFLLFIPKFFNQEIKAQSFSSDSYNINGGNFNMTSGRKSSINYQLTDTVGQNAPGQYDSAGFIVKSGFQYIHDTFNTFSFSINDLEIDFGTLVPNIGTTDTNIITITTPYGNGYQILAHQNHPLQIDISHQIPDTTGDNSTCTESDSDTWTQSDIYGFGFNAMGIDSSGVATGIGTSQFFNDIAYFRQFADYSSSESHQIIMSQDINVQDQSARISYKANISSVQPAGNYENAITFTAIPKY
ncbi:hypothetical protein KKC08_04245 [Patescibacteria group bacterium]|nr:hypothetical protein [Patescibacteria group bacterium]